MTKDKNTGGLSLLRVPFEAHLVSKLPKPTKRQTEEVKNNFKVGIRCEICNGWHHPKVVHLDYVGHAALTDRLLDCDPEWNWIPVTTDEHGAPVMDSNGGMWIKLTICGVTRLGYGHADNKKGGDAIKEVIGDALRNAAMRFGAALDLWHKGELHADGVDEEPQEAFDAPAARDRLIAGVTKQPTKQAVDTLWARGDFQSIFAQLPEPMQNEVKKAKSDCEDRFPDEPATQSPFEDEGPDEGDRVAAAG